MIVLSGATLVLPDRVLSPGTLVIDNGRIVEIRSDAPLSGHAEAPFAFRGHYIVPGFIDVHMHGVEGIDSLDARPDDDAVAAIASRLPRWGVTAFCPTTVACPPEALRACSIKCGARASRRRRARRACCRPISRATSSTLSTPVRSPRHAYARLGLRLGRVGQEGQEGREGTNGVDALQASGERSRRPTSFSRSSVRSRMSPS